MTVRPWVSAAESASSCSPVQAGRAVWPVTSAPLLFTANPRLLLHGAFWLLTLWLLFCNFVISRLDALAPSCISNNLFVFLSYYFTPRLLCSVFNNFHAFRQYNYSFHPSEQLRHWLTVKVSFGCVCARNDLFSTFKGCRLPETNLNGVIYTFVKQLSSEWPFLSHFSIWPSVVRTRYLICKMIIN